MEESNRQKRIGAVLQKDIANVLQNMLRERGQQGLILSVSKVTVSPDLSLSKVYISVFPAAKGANVIAELNENKSGIKHQLAQLTKHQLRKMPDLNFYLDDSLEYIEQIDKALKGEHDPIKNPETLPKRKQS